MTEYKIGGVPIRPKLLYYLENFDLGPPPGGGGGLALVSKADMREYRHDEATRVARYKKVHDKSQWETYQHNQQVEADHKLKQLLAPSPCDDAYGSPIDDVPRQKPKQKAPPKARFCEDCNADISLRSLKAKRCLDCAAEHDKARRRKAYAEANEKRVCLDCGISISHRGSAAVRCEEHAKAYRMKMKPAYDKKCKSKQPKPHKVAVFPTDTLDIPRREIAPDGYKWCSRGKHYVSLDEYGKHTNMCLYHNAEYSREYQLRRQK